VNDEPSGTTQNEQEILETSALTAPGPQEEEELIVPSGSPPQQPQQEVENDIPIRRSQRVRNPAISSDYEVYIIQDMNS